MIFWKAECPRFEYLRNDTSLVGADDRYLSWGWSFTSAKKAFHERSDQISDTLPDTSEGVPFA